MTELKREILAKRIGEEQGTLMEALRKMATCPEVQNSEFLTESLNVALHAGEEIGRGLQEMNDVFVEIKSRDIEMNQKIQELYKVLDRYEIKLETDRQIAYDACKARFKKVWNKLDEESKEYLITARYILGKLRADEFVLDCSPSVIEYCRAFENELLSKIFEQFITELAAQDTIDVTERGVDPTQSEEKLKDAIKDKKDSDRFFLSSTDMLECLRSVGRIDGLSEGSNCFELRQFIISQDMIADCLADNAFIVKAKKYVEVYRNEAAHPAIIDGNKAEKCQKETLGILKDFIERISENGGEKVIQ